MKILKIYATWCVPCKRLTQVIESIPNIPYPVEEVNIDTDMRSRIYGVHALPTCILVDDQEREVKRIQGLVTRQQFIEFIGAKQ